MPTALTDGHIPCEVAHEGPKHPSAVGVEGFEVPVAQDPGTKLRAVQLLLQPRVLL